MGHQFFSNFLTLSHELCKFPCVPTVGPNKWFNPYVNGTLVPRVLVKKKTKILIKFYLIGFPSKQCEFPKWNDLLNRESHEFMQI